MLDIDEKIDIAEITEAAKYLAENDFEGLMIVKSNIDILKIRAGIAESKTEKEKAGEK